MTIAADRGYAKGRAKRTEIIERATALFGEVGYRGSSLREIAARCGISHTGLLHHFENKESLLTAVLEARDAQDFEQFGGSTGVDQFRQAINLVALNETRRGIVELYVVLSAEAIAVDHPAHDYFIRRYRLSLGLVTDAYRLAESRGELHEGVDPVAAAQEMVALTDGLQLQWLLDGGRTPMSDLVRDYVQRQLIIPL